MLPGLEVTETETGILGLTSAKMGSDVTVLADEHVAFDIKVQVTTSPSAGGYENVMEFVPAGSPLTFH